MANSLISYLKSEPVAIGVRDLVKSFGDNHVLRGANLEVNPSETHVILGKSGAGKSVFLKCLVGLIEPDSGDIYINGINVRDGNGLRKYKIGYVFQSSALFNSLNVGENVGIYLKEHRITDDEGEYNSIVSGALDLVGLSGKEDVMPSELSGGMKRRVATARVLAMSPDLIIFDEPTTGLDPMMTKTIGELILTLKQSINTTQIVVTHDIEFAKFIADRISIISEGKIIDVGRPEDLDSSNNEIVKNFVSPKFKDYGGNYEERI